MYDYFELEEKFSELKFFHELVIVIFIHCFCGLLLFAIIVALKLKSDLGFRTMMKYNMISVRIENLLLALTLATHAYFRASMYDNQIFIDQFRPKVKDFYSVIASLDDSFNPNNIKKFKDNDNLPKIMLNQGSNDELNSFQVVYNMWSFTQVVYLLNSLISGTRKVFSSNQNEKSYLHISHINFTHFQLGI